ncbi:MAG TPA: hypothetical protein VFQ25_12065 [Ktedonobacterales bacterium]|nr:hypothetical protein [Ktedonobacterales bacterium]
MLQIVLVWAALGFLIGVFARLAGARSAYPRGVGGWMALARWALPPAAAALATVASGWLATMTLGRLAATAAALGVAAVVALLVALLAPRAPVPNSVLTRDAPARQTERGRE